MGELPLGGFARLDAQLNRLYLSHIKSHYQDLASIGSTHDLGFAAEALAFGRAKVLSLLKICDQCLEARLVVISIGARS